MNSEKRAHAPTKTVQPPAFAEFCVRHGTPDDVNREWLWDLIESWQHEAAPAMWDQLRHSLAVAMCGFVSRPEGRRGLDAAAHALDALTEPGAPLAWLRAIAQPEPKSADVAKRGTIDWLIGMLQNMRASGISGDQKVFINDPTFGRVEVCGALLGGGDDVELTANDDDEDAQHEAATANALTAQSALAAIETFEIVGENNDSREPNDEDRFILTEFIAHAFGGYRVEQHKAAPADDEHPSIALATVDPCPFCGSESIDPKGWLANNGKSGPACDDCGATAESVEAWNRRAQNEAAPAGVRWIAFSDALPPLQENGRGDTLRRKVLVTNNINSRDAFGDPSHVWIGNPEHNEKCDWYVPNGGMFLTHWADIFPAQSESQAAECDTCERDGIYAESGDGPFDCFKCGKKALSSSPNTKPVGYVWISKTGHISRFTADFDGKHEELSEGWKVRPVAFCGFDTAEGDSSSLVTIDVRDLFAYLRAAWREGQHYDREDSPDQADSWSAASDYANKTIEKWIGEGVKPEAEDKRSARDGSLRGEIAYQLHTRNRFLDMPTARAIVDDAFNRLVKNKC
ncbi:hypothetical protein CPT_Maja_080 [Burkholderia phage Maja]|uniref:Uncharacterized protein n=1 Tax=Burkholderia phage Maja TaxID=2767571 RepID=A0A7S6U3P1_9CAUD|nr:hypothetical protein CPT_Maja_080 [Burkholderia phage Maja]